MTRRSVSGGQVRNYIAKYNEMLNTMRSTFGPNTVIFAGCGPMSQTKYFCSYLQGIVASRKDPNLVLLDYRAPTVGKLLGCLDHPTWCVHVPCRGAFFERLCV